MATDDDSPAPRRLTALRLVLVAAQAATILLTWRVWLTREHPPLLPLLPLPLVDMGWPLLASLAFVVVIPRVGVPLHSGLLLWAILGDQCRMQPHVISLATLLWGTSGFAGGTVVARAALVALWLYAGLHKILTPAYYAEGGPWLLRVLWLEALPWLASPLAAAVAAAEIAFAVGALLPRWRPVVRNAAAAFHLATVLVLATRLRWNEAVWPWNLALACAAFVLLGSWRGWGLGVEWARSPRLPRGLAVVLLVLPGGYWIGVVDAYLAHCLYSNDVPRAFVCTPFSRTDVNEICVRHGVVLPPAHRLYAPFFRGVGRPGEWIEIEDPRWIARLRGFDRRKIFWRDLEKP